MEKWGKGMVRINRQDIYMGKGKDCGLHLYG